MKAEQRRPDPAPISNKDLYLIKSIELFKISISKIEVDPQNSFPGKFRTNLKINTELERQTLVLDLKGRFLGVGKFLDNYEKINAPLKLQSCDISLDTLDPIGVTAQLRFAMYTGIKS